MGGGGGNNKSSSSNTFKQNVPTFQKRALQNVYGQAGNLYQGTNEAMGRITPGVQDYMSNIQGASLPAWQSQLEGGAYSNIDANDVYGSLKESLNTPSNASAINAMIMGGAGNNYADAMKNQYQLDANRAAKNMLGTLDSRAQMAGQSGGARHGVATALGYEDINRNLQSNLAQTGFNTFDKDLDRKLAIAQAADQNTLARQGMLNDMLSQKQAAMTGSLNAAPQMQNLGMGSFATTMMPWQNMQNYSAAVGQPIVLGSGSGTSSGKGSNMHMGIGGGK